ncbi:hypothetical protein F0562_005306 [Nyssa sinensis]|uniref:non-specific serine/threonine protein kinase n=1 Tax=Nyssa sinensis TaxID=561372 RepID=A0A5J5AM69_9ASTE|nr:hypothetical protein F0562_005306 [Nyssa sinensis]
MKFILFSLLPSPFLIYIVSVLLHLPPSLSDNNGQYTSCGVLFNCGNITGVDYPFWGSDRPENCGYPGLKLNCAYNIATIEIMNVEFRVLDINQETKILKIARNDLMEDFNCAINGTDYKNGYVEIGAQGSGSCHVSVVVPISSTLFGEMVKFPSLKQVIAEGFEVKWKVDSAGCSECKNSNGQCGYDIALNQFTCFCTNQSSGSRTCTTSPADGGISLATSVSNPYDWYQTDCGTKFSCGNITGIDYPFRGNGKPDYCGYPGLVLNCQDNVTTINIMNVTYRVLGMDPSTETMKIAREDVMEATCPHNLVNTTLDYSLFDYASTHINITFLYGCPGSIPGLNLFPSCEITGYNGVYVFPWD